MSMDEGQGPGKGGGGKSLPEGLKPDDAPKPPQPGGLVGLHVVVFLLTADIVTKQCFKIS